MGYDNETEPSNRSERTRSRYAMHRTADTDTGRHWELRARVASGVLFAAALVAMAVFIVAAPVVGLTLSFRGTRRAAVVRAILAVVSVASLAFLLLLSFGLTGRSPDIVAGWVTMWALVGALVANVIASLAATRPIAGNAGPKARTPLGVGGS